MIKNYKLKYGISMAVNALKLSHEYEKFIYDWTNGLVTANPFYNDNLDNAWYMESYIGGYITAADGDYLLNDLAGRFHFCKAEVFEKAYEEVK